MPVTSSVLIKKFRIKTPNIAPDAINPTIPKVFSSAIRVQSFFIDAIPSDSASTNGTVIAPVAAPDASNAIAKKSADVNIAKPNAILYEIINIVRKGKSFKSRIAPNISKIPAPIATTPRMVNDEMSPSVMPDTCFANTFTSGSAKLIKKPKTKTDYPCQG